MKRPPDDGGILDGLFPPDLPGELRSRALEAARRAAMATPRRSLWHFLALFFKSQPAWTAAVAVLLVAHLVLTVVERPASPRPAVSPREMEIAAQPDLLRLPAIGGSAWRNLTPEKERRVLEGGGS